MSRTKSNDADLMLTKQHVQRQLAAVIELLQHKTSYLDPVEISWIESVILEAMTVSSDAQSTVGPKWHQGNRHNAQATKAPSQALTGRPAECNLDTLRVASRNLNSADHLLACCYDRWIWLHTARAEHSSPDLDIDDLHELLSRRRQQRKRVCHSPLEDNSFIQTSGVIDDPNARAPCIVSTDIHNSDSSLSLTIDDDIGRWRKNAEEALQEATGRLNSGSLTPPCGVDARTSQIWRTHPYLTGRLESASSQSDSDSLRVYACTCQEGLFQQYLGITSPALHSIPPGNSSDRIMSVVTNVNRTGKSISSCLQHTGLHCAATNAQLMLHNGLDKETINAVDPQTKDASTSNNLNSTCAYTSPNLILPLTGEKSRVNARVAASKYEVAALTVATKSSSVSLQSDGTNKKQSHRSRGRIWLEQEAGL